MMKANEQDVQDASDAELSDTFRACQSVLLDAVAGEFDDDSGLAPTLQRC